MVDMERQYRTRDGQEVRILCVDRHGQYPVVGLLREEGGKEAIHTWYADGQYRPGAPQMDLIAVRPERVVWFNEYESGYVSIDFRTPDEARQQRRVDEKLVAVHRVVLGPDTLEERFDD